MFEFKQELNYLKNENYKKSCEILLELLPKYFYEIPASSTGKYHPDFSNGSGGLVRHVKAAVRIAYELLNNPTIGNVFDNNEKDLIIVALLFHDGLKDGPEKEVYTRFDHPLLICNFIKENKDKLLFSDSEIELITRMIESHMGSWNTNSYSEIVLPLPSNKYQKFVHMCDFLASRKFLDIKFNQNELVG